jgi:hypothetical protein
VNRADGIGEIEGKGRRGDRPSVGHEGVSNSCLALLPSLPSVKISAVRHVAVCTVSQIDFLVSWNFRHLVNVAREKSFSSVNLLQGYQPIRIVSPLELIYGRESEKV